MVCFDVESTAISGLLELTPKVFNDERGYFFESYNAQALSEIGICKNFVQDNESRSTRGVLRGLHMQRNKPQAKLVRVVKGEVYDVAVDVRPESPTFREWHGVHLSEENKKQFYIPEGFLHGFLTLSEEAIFAYKCSDYYDPAGEVGVRYDDPDIGIKWPLHLLSASDRSPILGSKDAQNLSLTEISSNESERGA